MQEREFVNSKFVDQLNRKEKTHITRKIHYRRHRVKSFKKEQVHKGHNEDHHKEHKEELKLFACGAKSIQPRIKNRK